MSTSDLDAPLSFGRAPGQAPPPLSALLQPLKKPLRAYWYLAALTILAGWGKFILPMGLPLITGYLVDHVLTQPAHAGTPALLVKLAMASLLLVVLIGVATYYRSALAQRLASYLQHQLRRRMFHHIQRLSMAFFNRHHAGSLGSRVSSDINYAGVVVDKGLIQLSMDGVSLLSIAGYMVWIHPPLALLCFAMLACNAAVIRHYSPEIRQRQKGIQEQQSSVTGRAAEYFSAITVVKAFAGEGESGRNFSASSKDMQDLQLENSKLMGSFQGLSHALLIGCQFTLAIVGSWVILYHPSALSKGNLVEFLMFVAMINGSVQRLTESMIQIQDGFAALERIHDILKILPDPADVPNPVEPELTGAMRFENVTFGYKPGRPVLENFSFEFHPGRTYALVGPSGSGKSSLTQLMLRFYDPWEGRIVLDDTPLTEIRQSHYRKQVATVLQDPIIFSTSVRDNIGFATERPTQADIERAAKMAQAHDFIMAMEQGYDSRMGERGVALSGGQRQRIAIARALMRDPRFLILDEATSALDSVTERSIQSVVDALQGSRTVVIIAHRLSTVRNVDEILVIEKGRLVENGSYDQLVRQGGLFARMVHEQEMGITPEH